MSEYLNYASQACDSLVGNLIRCYQMVRRTTNTERRRGRKAPLSRSLHRPKSSRISKVSNNPSGHHFPPPKSLLNRKRKARALPSPMSRSERRDKALQQPSPWDDQKWLSPQSDYNSHFRSSTHETTKSKKRLKTQGEQRSKRLRSSELPYTRYDMLASRLGRSFRVGLGGGVLRPKLSMYADSDESDTLASHPGRYISPVDEDALHMDIDEEILRGANFAPTGSSESDSATQATKEEELEGSSTKEDDEENDNWLWDDEGQAEYRKLLRNLPESCDEQGFKVSIDGRISPDTERWNKKHRRKLDKEAAQQQQTSSNLSRHTVPSASDSTLPCMKEEASNSGPPALKSQEKASVNGEASKNTLSKENKSPKSSRHSSPDPLTKSEPENDEAQGRGKQAHSTQSATTDAVPPTTPANDEMKSDSWADLAAKRLKGLTISAKTRTPKARRHTELRTERKTRTDTVKAEREAAKNAYPIIELSNAWDQRVREAVNKGHGRFEAKMFNKCVPEYSRDPSAGSLWLDDAVINDYVAMVAKHGSKDDRPTQVRSVSALSSFFYTKISASSPNYSSCGGMLKRAGIQGKKLLECEKVFIPINKSYHWTLAVVEPKVPEGISPLDQPRKITVYNSMGNSGGRVVADNILKWIQHELGASFDPDEWEVFPAGRSPQQSNSDDCGVFTVTTARQIMLGKFNDKEMYKSDVINIQRKRIVAELVNGGLLSRTESLAD